MLQKFVTRTIKLQHAIENGIRNYVRGRSHFGPEPGTDVTYFGRCITTDHSH